MRKSDGKVILYTGALNYDSGGNIITDGIQLQYSTVPDIVGEYTYKAIARLKEEGFNVKITGERRLLDRSMPESLLPRPRVF